MTALTCNGDTFFLALDTGHLIWMHWGYTNSYGERESPCPYPLPVPASSLAGYRIPFTSSPSPTARPWRLLDLDGWRRVRLDFDLLLAVCGSKLRFFRFSRKPGIQRPGERGFTVAEGEAFLRGVFSQPASLRWEVSAYRGNILALSSMGTLVRIFCPENSYITQ